MSVKRRDCDTRAPAVVLRGPFGRLLTASTLSNFGDGIHVVAFPLVGASLTNDPTTIAALAAAGSVPALIGALPAGALVDRIRRTRLMVVLDIARTSVLAVLVALIGLSQLRVWHLFAVALLMGLGELFFDVSSSAAVPSLIPADDLARFNGRLSSARELANGLVGPAVAGFLYSFAAGIPFAVNALTFLASAGLLARLARGEPRNFAARAAAGFLSEIKVGALSVARDRPLRGLFLLIAGWSFFGFIPEAVLVLYAKQELSLGSIGYGALLAATSAGAVAGGVMASRLVTDRNAGKVLVPSLIAYAAGMIPPAFLSIPVAVGAVFFIQGIPILVFSVGSSTVRQLLIPRELMGRVSAIFYLAGAGSAPLGLVVGGFVADRLGLRATFVFGAAGVALSVLLLSRSIRDFDGRLNALARPADEATGPTDRPDPSAGRS